MCAWLVLAALGTVAELGVAQQAQDTAAARHTIEHQAGMGMSRAEVLERLRQSGLSRAQVRTRLQQMGHNPSLADQYFDAIDRGETLSSGEADTTFLSALEQIGVDVDPLPGDTTQFGDEDPEEPVADLLGPDSLEIFGRSVFARQSAQFQPITSGPVPPDYRLGPGDEISLILTGDVELAYSLPVTREGFLVVPDAGQIAVTGLTMKELEDRLYERLGRVYSGVRRSGDASTRFQVSLGALRAIQVFVIGDVERPNAYQVSAAATVFHALYLAGGPSATGSFRRIEVRRGGELTQAVDLYEYLLRGDSRSDVRLEHGDIIFVPPYDRRVTVTGAVRRPAHYELVEGEGLRDLLTFAGGLDADASVRRVQIDRVLPPEERRPGVERSLVDVDLSRLLDASAVDIEMRDGDRLQVFSVAEERRNRVVITGAVRKPGLYQWEPGMMLQELISRAEGLDERAYTPRAHIYRINEADGTRHLVRTRLMPDSRNGEVPDLALADLDSVVVFNRSELRNPDVVTIHGFVKAPGEYALADGMTVRDLILAAGGFIDGADTREVEVASLPDPMEWSDQTAIVVRVPISASNPRSGDVAVAEPLQKAARADLQRLPNWEPDSEEFVLSPGDRVFVRRAPGFEPLGTVTVTGQVMYPGVFALQARQERLLDLMERAGGLTTQAYTHGFQLYRDGHLVATNLNQAMRAPDGRHNIVLVPGDSLHVPEYDPVVTVTGAVTFEAKVLYEPGRGLDYYINRAGGFTKYADRDRITVRYADGERQTVTRFLKVVQRKPDVLPGSTIYVPEKPPSERGGFDWGAYLSRTTSILSTLATLLIAYDRINN